MLFLVIQKNMKVVRFEKTNMIISKKFFLRSYFLKFQDYRHFFKLDGIFSLT